MRTRPAWARNGGSHPRTTPGLSPCCTSVTLPSTGYVLLILSSFGNHLTSRQLILVWTFVPLPLWTALMAFGWGSMSMIQAGTHSFAGIMVLRFLIGAFEAGYVPAVALYMTFFYHRGEMGLRYGLFISCSPLASCFASALAYGLVHAKTSLHNWQLLFLVSKWSSSAVSIGWVLIEYRRGCTNDLIGRCRILFPPCVAFPV